MYKRFVWRSHSLKMMSVYCLTFLYGRRAAFFATILVIASWSNTPYTAQYLFSGKESTTMPTHSASRPQLSTAFFGFVLIGVASGAWGVLLPSLSAYYHVDQTVVGFIFFASATGYLLSALSTGLLMAKIGLRWYLVAGTALFMLCCFILAMQPPFALVLVIRLLQGMAGAIIEAGLNMFLAALPNKIALLNYLHAFFGAGALLGPLIASAILALSWGWNSAFFAWTLLAFPLLLGLLALFRSPSADAVQEAQKEKKERRLLAALKIPQVWVATLFLLFYVGIEVSLGNWGYTFLLESRHMNTLLAGWIVSGYWLGLTVGRFVLNLLAERLHLGLSGLMYSCMGGIVLGIVIIWLLPGDVVSAVAFFLIGTSLGPIYPSTVGLLPNVVPSHLLSSAMGFLIGLSILGAALFPWLAGTLAQYTGIWSLLPYTLGLTLVMLVLWWALKYRSSEVSPAA
ncbi:MAG TPA: MFS transporter [Ktedonobacterales bacterium]|nr:MFS transporter [Ktedonobacterales bacterium]